MSTIVHKYGGRVCFDSSVDLEEEDRRTARGIESRRQRKERKKMSYEFKKGRKRATAAILMAPTHRQRLVDLCGRDLVVDASVRTFLDEFVQVQGNNNTTDAILLAFHQLGITLELVATNPNVQANLETLGLVSSEFQDEFESDLPAAVVTSGSEAEDANQRRPRKRAKWRQMAANHLAVEADGQGPPAAPAAAAVV
jgi:hypothetical protein